MYIFILVKNILYEHRRIDWISGECEMMRGDITVFQNILIFLTLRNQNSRWSSSIMKYAHSLWIDMRIMVLVLNWEFWRLESIEWKTYALYIVNEDGAQGSFFYLSVRWNQCDRPSYSELVRLDEKLVD